MNIIKDGECLQCDLNDVPTNSHIISVDALEQAVQSP